MIDSNHFVTLMPDRVNDEAGTTMRDILLSMTPEARENFNRQLLGNEETASTWVRLCGDFAAVAYPETARWPEPDPAVILNEIPVAVQRLVSVVSLVNGRLLLRVLEASQTPTTLEAPTRLMTPTEFIFYVGSPVRRYVNELIKPRIDRLQKAIIVLTAASAVAYSVQYADGADQNARLHNVILHARDESQIKDWAVRNRYRLLAITPFQGDLA